MVEVLHQAIAVSRRSWIPHSVEKIEGGGDDDTKGMKLNKNRYNIIIEGINRKDLNWGDVDSTYISNKT